MITLPIIYLIISLVLGLSLIVISHKVLSNVMAKRFSVGPETMTFNLLAAGLMVSLAMLMSEAARPMVALINLLSRGNQSGWELTAITYIFGFYILIILVALLIIFGSVFFFHRMTGNLDEQAELSKQNNGVALLLAMLIVSMTLFLKSPLVSVFEALIPYPNFAY